MQLTLDGSGPYENRALFAKHFLENRLVAMPEWRDMTGLAAAFKDVKRLFHERAAKFGDSTNESQTEHDFIQPVLDLLWADQHPGDCYQVQVSLPSRGASTRQPDYALFRSAADRDGAQAQMGSLDYWSNVACVGDAKRWSASLDTQRRDESPAAQLTNYLYRSKVRWGILTNGRYWRLYELEQSRGGGVYYEVDLAQLVLRDDSTQFQYFLHFFRRAAFVPDTTGRSFLDKVLEGSVTYAAQVTERLKDSVYDALRLVINGFLDRDENRLDRADDATLRLVHDNALIVLYRLLFILYAEDRELLPRRDRTYQNYSLQALQHDINETLKQFLPYLPIGTHLWSRLLGLFRLIDVGYPPAGIAAYNGGLFSPTNHPHLAYTPVDGVRRWEIGDDAVAQAIDLLAYERQPGASYGVQDIDYATMAVQHLGSIYEGLLELQPRRATEPLVEVVRGNSAAFVTAGDAAPVRAGLVPAPARRIEPGEIYLATDRGERKATGSYYTPTYIVDYIVEQTIEPLVAEAAARVATLRPDVDVRIAALEAERDSLLASELDTHRREAESISARIEAEKARLAAPYLALKILDPAMGSGHFLVGAADFLSMQMAGDEHLLPPAAMGADDPQIYYKRLIVERCLYGVDLNPLAVELAKLSLWLHTVSGDRALSFLGHHLRCGNSLVGARLAEDLAAPPPALDRRGKIRPGAGELTGPTVLETLRARHLGSLLGAFQQIAEAPAGDAATERAKAGWYAAMDREREPYRQVANLWLAPCFGVEVTAEQYQHAVEALRDGGTVGWVSNPPSTYAEPVDAADAEPVDDGGLETQPTTAVGAGRDGGLETQPTLARDLAAERRFFHWELEFPEAFLSATGLLPADQRGFDAVIGNPPYVRQEQLAPFKPYLADAFASYHSVADLYIYFYERGVTLLRDGRSMAFISSGTYTRANFAVPFRRWLPAHACIESVIDFGENQPFDGAEMVRPSILVLRRQSRAQEAYFRTLFLDGPVPPNLSLAARSGSTDCPYSVLHGSEWVFEPEIQAAVSRRLLDVGRPLGEVVGGRMYYGVKTGLNEAFIIDQATRERLVAEDAGSAEILKPLVRGEDLRPWYQEEEGRWLVRVPSGWTREAFGPSLTGDEAWRRFGDRYPAVAGWLEPFADRAIARQDKGDYWWELRSCDYYEAFDGPKIFWPDICKLPRYSLDVRGKYINDKGFIISAPPEYLLALLQSRVLWYAVSRLCVPLRLRAGLWQYQMKGQFVRRLPIIVPSPETASAIVILADGCTSEASHRYVVDEATRHRLLTDLGTPDAKLNQKLTAWWELDWGGLQTELARCFKRHIPVAERDEWEAWFAARKAEHARLTSRIVELETELNDRVYHLYGLTAEEIAIVERVTKYRYGEV